MDSAYMRAATCAHGNARMKKSPGTFLSRGRDIHLIRSSRRGRTLSKRYILPQGQSYCGRRSLYRPGAQIKSPNASALMSATFVRSSEHKEAEKRKHGSSDAIRAKAPRRAA